MTIATRILWLYRAVGRPVPDVAIEKMLADVPPSSVRGARRRLERSGAIVRAGVCGTGRGRRGTWRLANCAANTGSQ
jgi:hypothetical protein